MSAVPAAEVMALELVLGIVKPAEAIIGTIIIVALLPGTPPTECLSRTIPGKWSLFPVFTIALVKFTISLVLRPLR